MQNAPRRFEMEKEPSVGWWRDSPEALLWLALAICLAITPKTMELLGKQNNSALDLILWISSSGVLVIAGLFRYRSGQWPLRALVET